MIMEEDRPDTGPQSRKAFCVFQPYGPPDLK
jgi:hypothetical protein